MKTKPGKRKDNQCILSTEKEFSPVQEGQSSHFLTLFHGLFKAFDCVDHNKLWTILKEMGIPDHLMCLLRNLYAGQEATELDVEQRTGSKLGKEYVKAVYCQPIYLTYM